MSKRMVSRVTQFLAIFGAGFLLLAAPSGCQSKGDSKIEMEIIQLTLVTPAAGWAASPIEAWETETTLFCLFQLTPPEGMAAPVISEIESKMQIPVTSKPKRLVVLGKTWNWNSSSDIQFSKDRQTFRSSLSSNAKRIEITPLDTSER